MDEEGWRRYVGWRLGETGCSRKGVWRREDKGEGMKEEGNMKEGVGLK